MKKILWIALSAALAAAAAIVVFHSLPGEAVSAQEELSELAAATLQVKIDAIKKAAEEHAERAPIQVELSEAELESYVVHSLKHDIPVKIDSIDVQLTEGAIAANVTVTSGANGTGNPMVDVLLGGTHSLFMKGTLSATAGKGRFELQEVKLDGIPVPPILIETLVAKYVKPRYPDVDLNAPFTVPWGIEEITITTAKARIAY